VRSFGGKKIGSERPTHPRHTASSALVLSAFENPIRVLARMLLKGQLEDSRRRW
jgi:hypothetical protein